MNPSGCAAFAAYMLMEVSYISVVWAASICSLECLYHVYLLVLARDEQADKQRHSDRYHDRNEIRQRRDNETELVFACEQNDKLAQQEISGRQTDDNTDHGQYEILLNEQQSYTLIAEAEHLERSHLAIAFGIAHGTEVIEDYNAEQHRTAADQRYHKIHDSHKGIERVNNTLLRLYPGDSLVGGDIGLCGVDGVAVIVDAYLFRRSAAHDYALGHRADHAAYTDGIGIVGAVG